MPRIYTRAKRKLNITSSRLGRFRNIKGKKGAKTFKTEERAKEYATTVLKLKEFSVVPAKKNTKFKTKQLQIE